MEARVDYVTSRLEEDEEASAHCILCHEYKPTSQMGSFNCLECEGVVAARDAEVEELIEHFDYILEGGTNDRIRATRVTEDDARSVGITQRPLFD